MSSIHCQNAQIDLNEVRGVNCISATCTLEFVNDPQVYIVKEDSSCYQSVKKFHDLMLKYQTHEKKQSLELVHHAVRINNMMAEKDASIYDRRDEERENIKSTWTYPYY